MRTCGFRRGERSIRVNFVYKSLGSVSLGYVMLSYVRLLGELRLGNVAQSVSATGVFFFTVIPLLRLAPFHRPLTL